MTKDQFSEWEVDVHSSLFHIDKTDLHDKYGVRIDQLIVLTTIKRNPEVLKHKTLEELLISFDVL